ncbi:MAG TPA: SPFH domain-containing protein, partial [Chroococcales cyanobacterium]
MFEIIGGIVIFSVLVLLSGVKTVKEHDRMVVFRAGKILGSRGPGMHLIVPFLERGHLVDARPATYSIEPVEAVTSDNCHLKVTGLLVAQVVEAARAISKISDYQKSTVDTAQAVIAEAIRRHTASEVVDERKRLNHRIKSELEKRAKPWGVRIRSLEIK